MRIGVLNQNRSDILQKMIELEPNDLVKRAATLLLSPEEPDNFFQNAVSSIAVYSNDHLPHEAYMILENGDLKLIGDNFQEMHFTIEESILKIEFNIPELDSPNQGALIAWIQLGENEYGWELYRRDNIDYEIDYFVLLGHGTTYFTCPDIDLQLTLESLITHVVTHRSGYYHRL